MKYLFIKVIATVIILITSVVCLLTSNVNIPSFLIFFVSLAAIVVSDYIELFMKYVVNDEMDKLKQQVKDLDIRLGLRGF